LTAEDRSKAAKGIYYICVYGRTAATYKLTVKNAVHENYLKAGLSESGYLDTNQTRVYFFKDSILALEGAKLEL
jgi:hypothetical protein